jgi:hypothetical protein
LDEKYTLNNFFKEEKPMKFGVREICDVVLKAKAAQKVGNKIFYKNEPVLYFDTLKTSTMEGAATTVYAQGGRGNSRLMAWEGERTITFTMEDALISAAGFMILSGAGLIEATGEKTIKVHTTEQTDEVIVDEDGVKITISSKPYCKGTTQDKVTTIDPSEEDFIYVMRLVNGEVVSEPYIPMSVTEVDGEAGSKYVLTLRNTEAKDNEGKETIRFADDLEDFRNDDVVLVDYYVEKAEGAQQIEITPDKFGANYYLEASTLFRDTNGVDMPAEFVIPNCKIQSNFSFSMASSGDPSTFTFTMDAFPDYTRFDKTKKVLAAIQIVDVAGSNAELVRKKTASADHKWFE